MPVAIPLRTVELEGDLAIPEAAHALVLFAHGTGSSRLSPRNQFVAQQLRELGLGTLLFDLLTADEEVQDDVDGRLHSDVPLLAWRLGEVTDWVARTPATRGLSIGYFGASTGAAAALIAAADRPRLVRAIVSRGGRPDLAGEVLPRVRAPTLFIVGGADQRVLALNETALERMQAHVELTVIEGASHLFEQPGALAEVARLAGAWFERHLARGAVESRPPLHR